MSDVERRYHETWLGMVQPIEGLVFSVPVLVDASVMQRTAPEVQERFREHLVSEKQGDGERVRVRDLRTFLRSVLGFADADFLAGDDVPRALCHYVPEGRQTITPTFVLKNPTPPSDGAGSEPRDAAELLIWQLPDGLPLDRAETVTGPWEYPPHHKLDRLLRGTRVPMGLVTNGEVFRLIYAPHGESTGALTFRVADMASVGGRPILDAFLSLLSAHRFFVVAPDRTLRSLLEQSRKRQANVTNELADQVFEALDLLLHGFEAAAERDGTSALREAMQDESGPPHGGSGEHVYGGLLTAMLRLVFLLYAEDRDLMPMGNPVYAKHLSVLGLFDQLQQDAGLYPDTMGRRFGAWPRLLALFRAVYEGVDADGLQMPARRGKLFDPNGYPFLEGWTQGGAAPHAPEDRAQVRVPSIDDETLYRVLDKLLLLDGQRLSYRALDVEQIGSVYEALMGYHVQRLVSPAVCLRDSGVWLETARVLETPANRREALVIKESALPKGRVAKVADALKAAKTSDDVVTALEPLRKAPKAIPVRQAGALVLQPGSERRRTSSHYTPRSLSAPIVEKTLRPLIATMSQNGKEPTADELLELKICDPAMGSGAFLVEACRYLADEVVKAWTRQGIVTGIEHEHGDPVTHARRLVAQCCLYGVDKNPYAVTLAKLSLWLVSFAKNEPFTFVDHSLRWGDSLVGLSLEQLRRFHWAAGSAQADFVVDIVTKDLDEAMYHRQRILRLARLHGVQNARAKEDLLRDADDAVTNARLLADILLGAFFEHEKEKDREKERLARLTAAQQWVTTRREPTEQLRTWQSEMRAVTPPFHWPIEFPEVFYAGRVDPLDPQHATKVAWMDAFVGNPPFMGGKMISTNNGDAYASWLESLHATSKNADYSAHFFRRAWTLLGEHGTLGLIATNTIAQGDTRAAGLQHLIHEGGSIYDATRSMLWPGEAAVDVSVVHIAKGLVGQHMGERVLDGVAVAAVNSRLRGKPERTDPVSLAVNRSTYFNGCFLRGQGFVITETEAQELSRRDVSHHDVVRPFLGGDELNTSPTQAADRFVIDFADLALDDVTSRWPVAIALLRDRVKPERDRLGSSSDDQLHKTYWWRFAKPRMELRRAIARLRRTIVVCIHAKHLIFSFQPVGPVFSHAIYIFPFEDDARFAVMQSRVHESWAWLLSSTMRNAGIRYTPSDCFETFPFPRDDKLAPGGALDAVGERLDATRTALMLEAQQGLTTTYNQLKDPACTDPRILELRKLHEEMDRAVLDAYGWTDLAVPPYCPMNEANKKQLAAFEDEVIDRLFALNAERAKEEELLGLGPKKPPTKGAKKAAADDGENPAPKKKAGKKKVEPEGQGGLF
jgi:hypothetical protein